MSAYLSLLLLIAPMSQIVYAADWNVTEVQHQYGNMHTPNFSGGGKSGTHSITLQHASGWAYGENFFFLDLINSSETNFNDADIYSEWYPSISLTRLSGRALGKGLLRELSILTGLNFGATPKVIKLLPGARLTLNLPRFAFANIDFMAYLDFSEGFARGGAPAEDHAFIVDFNWALPFKIGSADFSIEGHIEYIAERENELGNTVSWHILGQPQFRIDLGKALGTTPGRLFAGTEIQLWINKLGDPATDELVPQSLIVWRF